MSIEKYKNKFEGLKSNKPTTTKKKQSKNADKLIAINPYFEETPGGMKKFLHAKHAEDISKQLNCAFDGQYLWHYHDGYFTNDGEAHYRVIGQQLLGEDSKRHYISESLYYAQNARRLLETTMNPPTNLINLRNGMLDPLTGEIHSHSPEYLSTYQLPITYNPKANEPIIHKFVSSVLPEDSHDAFYEMIGYMLSNNLHLEKAFMFTGSGANGKSVAIDMISALIGKENVSHVSLQDLDHRFRLGQIEGKLLNAFSDLPQKPIEDTGNFKAIVSNEPITIEHKNKDPKRITPTTKLLFSANHMVVTPDMSDGYFRRWLLFEFKNKFDAEKRDINLLKKLTTEIALSTLLNKAIEGLQRLYKNKCFSENESLKESLHKYKTESNSVNVFYDEVCELSTNEHFIPMRDFYKEYEKFCKDNGFNRVGVIKFNDRIKNINSDVETSHKKISGISVKCWIGIKFKDECENIDIASDVEEMYLSLEKIEREHARKMRLQS